MRPVFYAAAMSILVSAIGSAQFAEFAVPANGSKLYFSSPLPLAGSNEPQQGRIFSVDSAGVHTVADVPATTPTPYSSYYALSRPELSRDGTILIYTGTRDCYGSSNCESSVTTETERQTTITGLSSGPATKFGAGRISGSGRYLLLNIPLPSESASILDLQTGQSQTLSPPCTPDGLGRVVADDGTVVCDQADLIIAKGSGSKSISFAGVYAEQAVIDSAAQMVVYVQFDYAAVHYSIHGYSLSQQKDVTLFSQGNSTAPFVTADGTRAMFISTASGSPQIWIVNTDATGARQVTTDLTGVRVAAMSDDGTTGWYLTNSGRVMQVDLNSGAAQQWIGRTPDFVTTAPPMAPGSVWMLEGAGFSDTSFTASGYPLPPALGGVSVSIGGITAPIFSVAPTQIVVQVPWETPAANFSGMAVNVVISMTYSSPFVGGLSSTGSAWSGFGEFVQDPADPYVLAVHQDWSALVTPSNPARPNEILHLYGYDFGPVKSHAADGMPAAAAPLPGTITPIACWAWGADKVTKMTIPVLYSGLAPGVAGYYQLDVQLPGSNLRADTQLSCTGSGYDDDFNGTVPVMK
jgi:uncharacterized protein (TIGR03437 family)